VRVWVLVVIVLAMVSFASAQPSTTRFGRVIKIERHGDETLVTVAAGTAQGVDKTMYARIVTASGSDVAIPGGDLIIIRVDNRTTIAKTQATVAQVKDHPWVRFEVAGGGAMRVPFDH
jgi:hypothetical protein